jgi:predicted HTH domain antitoxin
VAFEAILVRLYDQGSISSGKAAHLLGIEREDFLKLLGRYKVSIFDPKLDLDEDVRNANAAARY